MTKLYNNWYKLVDKVPVKVESFEDPDFNKRTTVGKTILPNGGLVSTVFLRLDHNYQDEGDPLLFESMYFPDYPSMDEGDCERYCTWEEAVEGHRNMVEKYGGTVSPKDIFDEDDDLFKM